MTSSAVPASVASMTTCRFVVVDSPLLSGVAVLEDATGAGCPGQGHYVGRLVWRDTDMQVHLRLRTRLLAEVPTLCDADRCAGARSLRALGR